MRKILPVPHAVDWVSADLARRAVARARVMDGWWEEGGLTSLKGGWPSSKDVNRGLMGVGSIGQKVLLIGQTIY